MRKNMPIENYKPGKVNCTEPVMENGAITTPTIPLRSSKDKNAIKKTNHAGSALIKLIANESTLLNHPAILSAKPLL